MKKIIYALFTVSELIFLLSAYIVHYFTNKKMGMIRHVIAKNSKFEQLYPIETLQFLIFGIFILLLILIFFIYKKKKFKIKADFLVSTFLVIAYIIFNLRFSTSTVKAYYYIIFLSGIGVLIQLVKTIIFLPRRK